jgi:predicted enzyme related to lactoylglutathione lyase
MKAIAMFAIGAGLLAAVPAGAQVQAPSRATMPRGAAPDQLPKISAGRVYVADMDRSERFYREALGAVKTQKFAANEWVLQFASGAAMQLYKPADAGAGGASTAGFIFEVADLDATSERVVRFGGSIVRAAQPASRLAADGVRTAIVRDPDGVGIELIQLARE